MEKSLAEMSVVEILDKNIDQEQLLKDLSLKVVQPKIAEIKAKINSGELDLIKGTDIDKVALLAMVEVLEKSLLGV